MGTGDLAGGPLWSILTPTLSSRREKLRRLLDVLLPQAEDCPCPVEVVALHNDGEEPLAEYRQALIEDARGRWVSFVDDDDMVSEDFVQSITDAITLEDPDVVAFRAWLYTDGVLHPKECRTGIQYGRWFDGPDAYYRDIIHLMPVRALIAKKADFRLESEGMEDWTYVSQVRPLLKAQAEVDKVLYHYLYDSGDTVQRGLRPHMFGPRLEVASPVFRWHDWSTG